MPALGVNLVTWLLLFAILVIIFLFGMAAALLAEALVFRKSLLGSNSRLRGQVEAEKRTRAAFEQTVKAREAEYNRLNGQITLAKADLETSRTRVVDLEGAVKRAKTDLDASQKQNAQLKADIEKSKALLQARPPDIVKSQADLQTREAELVNLRARFQQMDAGLKQRNDELSDLNARFKTAREGLQAVRDRLAQLETDKTRLTSMVAEAQARANAAETELAQAKQRLGEFGKGVVDLATFQTTKSTLQGDITRLNADLNEANDRAEQLKGEYDEVFAERSRLSIELNELKSQARWLSAVEEPQLDSEDERDALPEVQEMEPETDEVESAKEHTNEFKTTTRYEIGPDGQPVIRHVVRIDKPAPFAIPMGGHAQSRAEILAPRGSRDENDETPFVSACPQRLTEVSGINSLFETLLYEAGIGSYWQLSQLTKPVLKRILQLSDPQAVRVDLDGMIAGARKLAKQTKSLGRIWNAEPADDMTAIHGLSPENEKRLSDAGICTYEALSKQKPEQLDRIIQAPPGHQPEYRSWIDQAKTLLAQKS